MKIPQVVHADDLVKEWPFHGKNGEWFMARPLPMYTIFERWKCAWLVFTGQADALLWRNQ
jgi:hypothetical protein